MMKKDVYERLKEIKPRGYAMVLEYLDGTASALIGGLDYIEFLTGRVIDDGRIFSKPDLLWVTLHRIPSVPATISKSEPVYGGQMLL